MGDVNPVPAARGYVLPDTLYDVTKFVAMILLPGLGTLYFALSGIWGFPNAEQVVGTVTAVDTFLGLLLGLSTRNYTGGYDGVVEGDGVDKMVLKLPLEPEELLNKKFVKLKVTGQPPVD